MLFLKELPIWQAFGFSLFTGALAGSILYAVCVLLLCCVDRRRRHAGAPPPDPKIWLPDHAHHRRRRDESSEMECSICLGELEEGERCCTLAACRHEFHKECIYRWLANRNTCPLCRHMPLPTASSPPPAPPPHHASPPPSNVPAAHV